MESVSLKQKLCEYKDAYFLIEKNQKYPIPMKSIDL